MSPRRPDSLKVEAVGVGTFDRFTSFSCAFDLTQPSEANFELGDDGTWSALEKFIAHGTIYKIYVNNVIALTGRVEVQDVPTDLEGSVVRFSIRTKMADAVYASADPKTRTTGVTLKQFILALYKPLGYVEKDFVFDPNVARNLMTGKSSTSSKPPTDFEPTREDQAKVKPPETIFQAADRHLRRFGLMHWDSPDGKIVVGAPDDSCSPTYYFRMLQGPNGRANNLLSANRIRDWSGVPSGVIVFGARFGASSQLTAIDTAFGSKTNTTSSVPSMKPIRANEVDSDVLAAGFHRPVIIVNEGLVSAERAQRTASREMTNRRKKKEVWELATDGLTYWDGNSSTPFGINTVCDITSSVAGGPAGQHLIHRVELSRTPVEGDKTRLMALKKGLWAL